MYGNLTAIDAIGQGVIENEIVETHDSGGSQAPILVVLIKQHANYSYRRRKGPPRVDNLPEIVDINAFKIWDIIITQALDDASDISLS